MKTTGIKINKEKGTITLDYRDKNHKRHRETFVGNITFAKELLAKRKAQIAENKFFPERNKYKLTFTEAANKYWEIHLSKKKSGPKLKSTIKLLKTYFGNKPLAQITTEDVQEYYNYKITQASAPTANRHFTTLNAIINKVIKLKIYKGDNPCVGVAKQKENPPRNNFLSKAQIKDMLLCIADRSKTLFAFAIYTGMRRGEILRVDWRDIDLGNNIIHIYESKSGYKREVPIAPTLKQILLRMNPQQSGKVFNLSTKQIEFDFNHALKQTGIKGICFHSCRHAFASHFMMSGGSITDLQRILGHSDLKLTQRYAHLSPTYLRKSIEVVNDLIPQLQ